MFRVGRTLKVLVASSYLCLQHSDAFLIPNPVPLATTRAKLQLSRTTLDDQKSVSATRPQVDWENIWAPLAFSKVTDEKIPHHITVLGHQLALFQDPRTGEWKAVEDSCPHRLARLSEGRIDENGAIQCPYHGWSFDGTSGECLAIPHAEKGQIPGPRACVRTYPTVVKQDLIWAWMGNGVPDDESTIPVCNAIGAPGVVTTDIHRDLPYDYETLLENLMDASHIHFTHHSTTGNRKRAAPMPMALTPGTELTAKGFTGTAGPNLKTVFEHPFYMMHTIDLPSVTTRVLSICVPSSPGRSRVFARFPMTFKGNKFPAKMARFIIPRLPLFLSHTNSNIVLDDDAIFLHHQERRLLKLLENGEAKSWASACHLATASDLWVKLFRDWLEKFAGGGPWGGLQGKLSSRSWASREDLLDRYNQHTISCKSCSKALKTVEKARPLLLLTSFISAIVSASIISTGRFGVARPLVFGFTSAICLATYNKLSHFRSLLRFGVYPPPRNREDKEERKRLAKAKRQPALQPVPA